MSPLVLLTFLLTPTTPTYTTSCPKQIRRSIISVRTIVDSQHLCAGVLVSATSVLTAASCVRRFVQLPSYLRVAGGLVYTGDHHVDDTHISYVSSVSIGPKEGDNGSLAIVHMMESLPAHLEMRTMKVARNDSLDLTEMCTEGLVCGWGSKTSQAVFPYLVKSVRENLTALECRRLKVFNMTECVIIIYKNRTFTYILRRDI